MAQGGVAISIVVIGGSAGSLEAIFKLLPLLPPAAGAAFVLVVHRKNDAESLLVGLLSKRTTMPVKEVEDKEQITANTVYIAPPDYHLLIENKKTFSLDGSEKIQYSRPSIDVTFQSVAEVFGSETIGIILSGANADGADGLKTIKDYGGFTIVQDPVSAEVDYMPKKAIERAGPNAVLEAGLIAPLIIKLLSEKPPN